MDKIVERKLDSSPRTYEVRRLRANILLKMGMLQVVLKMVLENV